jgi:hypothetical protein
LNLDGGAKPGVVRKLGEFVQPKACCPDFIKRRQSALQVLQEMLDMLHEHENQVHAARLEIIVIWLIGAATSPSFKPHSTSIFWPFALKLLVES